MKWRSRQRAHTRSEKPGDEVNMHGGSWDATRREAALDSPGIRLTPSTSQEGNAAMAVAREAETAQDRVQQIEERIFLTETAMKLRVALFPEVIRAKAHRSVHVVPFLYMHDITRVFLFVLPRSVLPCGVL